MKTGKFNILFFVAIAVLLGLSFNNEKEELTLTDNEYKVITVRGRIVFEKSGRDMKRGDLYVKGTPLNFKTRESRASIISNKHGRYVLSGNSKGKLKILPSSNNISTRAGALLNLVDLKNHFDGRYLVIKRMELQIGHEAFPQDGDRYFYLKYKHDNEVIAKKLRAEGDFLILDRDEIFKIDGKSIPVMEKEMTLYYKGEAKTLKINKFTPIFPNMNVLKEEIDLLLGEMDDSSNLDKIGAVTSYLNEFYGRPYKPNLENWLSAEFGLTMN